MDFNFRRGKTKEIVKTPVILTVFISLNIMAHLVAGAVNEAVSFSVKLTVNSVLASYFLFQLKRAQRIDDLTQLLTIKEFLRRLDRDLAIKDNLCVVSIDMLLFRNINFSYGYEKGDQILAQLASRMKSFLSKTEYATRSYGDKFYLLLNRDDKELTTSIKELSRILNHPYLLNDNKFYIRTRVAYCYYTEEKSVEELILKASLAMSSFKESDNFNIQQYESWMQKERREQVKIIERLYKAVEESRFDVYFQPILNIKDKEIVALEALVRWFDPILGTVPPDKFINIAEELELISQIGEIVQRKVFEIKRRWKDENFKYMNMKVFINLSPIELREKSLVNRLEKIDPVLQSQIGFEITEDYFIESSNEWRTTLNMIKNLDICLSLDDFGTRYSSFEYLKDLPIDYLKLDRTFILNIDDNKNYNIVKFVISMCHSLGIKVIAEGVEHENIYKTLKELECDFVQGYYFHKPMSIENIEKL